MLVLCILLHNWYWYASLRIRLLSTFFCQVICWLKVVTCKMRMVLLNYIRAVWWRDIKKFEQYTYKELGLFFWSAHLCIWSYLIFILPATLLQRQYLNLQIRNITLKSSPLVIFLLTDLITQHECWSTQNRRKRFKVQLSWFWNETKSCES